MKIFDHTYYHLDYNAEKRTLSFHWKEAHANMNFEDFKEACSNFVGYAFQYNLSKLLVDTRNFAYKMPEEYANWQKDIHQPRLQQLNDLKMAYLMPESAMSFVKNQAADKDNFATSYFTETHNAMTWLAAN